MTPQLHGKRVRLRITAVVLSTFVTLAACELILRWQGTYLTHSESSFGRYESYYGKILSSWTWTHSPDASFNYPNHEFSFEVKTNSEGLRDGQRTVEKDSRTFRIIVSGDSYTEGVGAPFDQTITMHMERLYAGMNCQVEVLNGGVAGSDPFFSYQLLKLKLLKYEPDLVVFLLNESDMQDFDYRGGMERFREDGTTQFRQAPFPEFLYHYSHIIRAFCEGFLGYNRGLTRIRKNEADNDELFQAFVNVFKRFGQLAMENGFQLLILVHPTGSEIVDSRNGFADDFWQVMEKHDIHIANLGDEFRDKIGTEKLVHYIWPVDNHFTPAGYSIMAEVMTDRLTHIVPCVTADEQAEIPYAK